METILEVYLSIILEDSVKKTVQCFLCVLTAPPLIIFRLALLPQITSFLRIIYLFVCLKLCTFGEKARE